MRALAEFTMRGRMQATLAVAGSAVVPLLFWLSAAAGSLVLLRRGFGDAFGVLAWAVLPAMFWWYLGDPSILLVLLGTLTLAQILRASMSWSHVLLGSVAVGVVFALVLGHTSSELIGVLATEVSKVLTQLRGESQLSGEELEKLQVALVPTLTGVMASSLQVTCLLCLMLARYWQASLYNPGGFGREFRSLRLAPAVAVILLLGGRRGPGAGSAGRGARSVVQRAADHRRRGARAWPDRPEAPGGWLAGGPVPGCIAAGEPDLSFGGCRQSV